MIKYGNLNYIRIEAMKFLKKLFVASLVGVVISGCANTSTEGPAKYPELKVLSNTPYVWDDSISEALNVARMAQPAGPGVGMKDFEDGKKAATGKITGGTRLLDAGLGLISMGGFGVLSMESLNAGINRQLDWKPTLVTLIPKNSAQIDHKVIRDIVGTKIKTSMEMDYPGIEWFGGYTLSRPFKNADVEFLFFDENGCRESIMFDYKDKNAKADFFYSGDRGRKFVEGNFNKTKYCALGGLLKVAGVTNLNGKEHYVVTFEIAWGHYFNKVMAKNFNGYVLMPELYDFRAADVMLNIVVNEGYAKVYNNGKELLFQKK